MNNPYEFENFQNKQSEFDQGLIDGTRIMDQQIPIDVRAADQTIFSEIMQGTPMKSDIRD